jgi:hypothetical protein
MRPMASPPTPPNEMRVDDKRRQTLLIAQQTLELIEGQLTILEQMAKNLHELLDSIKAENREN